MVNEYLIVTGSLCLVMALLEAWTLVTVSTHPDGRAAKAIPGAQDLLKSHIDYLLMAILLFVFYLLFSHFQIAAAAFVIVCMCLGSFGNALLFLIRAAKPGLKEQPSAAFHLGMFVSCSLTTVGYASGAWLVARAAATMI